MNLRSVIRTRVQKIARMAVDRKERDRKLRKDDILKAAERVFARRGYEKATMQSIAREAQYATGTVYLYFKDKEDLYFSLVEEKLEGAVEIFKEKTSVTGKADEKLSIFIHELLDFFEKNQDFFRIYTTERAKILWPIDRKLSKSPAVRHVEFPIELIRLGQKQGSIREDLDAQELSDILISIFTTVILSWLTEPKKGKGLKDAGGPILDVFLRGAGKR